MAVVSMTGFETQSVDAENGLAFTGTASLSTAQHRTGAVALRCNPASGATGFANVFSAGSFAHFGLYIASMPTLARSIFGTSGTNVNVRLNADGTLEYFDSSTSRGVSVALSTATWYWIGVRITSGSSVPVLQVDGVTQITASPTSNAASAVLGCTATTATAIDVYFDDYIADDAGFLGPSNVALLRPISDNAKGTGWTNDAAATTNLFDAVDNTPPVGIADTSASTGLHQLRNATANANVNYDANLTTYATAGIVTGDTVLAVQQIIATAAPVTTSSKQGTFGISSNPVISNVALGSGGTAGAFWSGVAAGTYVTGWKITFGALTLSPTVTIASSPVARVTQVTSSTRIAMVCFMAMYVAWTPAIVPPGPYTNPYPPMLAQ